MDLKEQRIGEVIFNRTNDRLEIVDYVNKYNILVKSEGGIVIPHSYKSFKKGGIKTPICDYPRPMERYNKFGTFMMVTKFISSNEVEIYFPKYDCHARCTYQSFALGTVKCKFEPRYRGVGYEGEGKYLMYENGKLTFNARRWYCMIDRTHGWKHRKSSCYKDVLLDEEWFNFQNFAEWNEANYYEVDGDEMHLDKDLLSTDVKIYSPKTCVYLPSRLNEILAKGSKEQIANVLYSYKDLPKWTIELVEAKCEL